jgi:hypothetical protein
MNYIHLLEFASSVGLTSVTAYLIFKIVSAIQRQNAMMVNEIADFEDVSEILEDEDEDSDTDKIDIESDEECEAEGEDEEANGDDEAEGQDEQEQQEDVNMDIESEEVLGAITDVCPPEPEHNEITALSILENRLLAEIDLLKKNQTLNNLENNLMLLSKFETLESTTQAKVQGFSEVTVDKFHDLEDLVELKIQQLEKTFQQKLDGTRQVLENVIVGQKESFLPLLAKKEIDKNNWQGWLASSTLDGVDLEITIENRSYTSYESNDAWVDATTKTNDSATYRDSLLGLEDVSSWHISDSIVKRYITFAWNGSTHIQVTLKNLPRQKQTQADARDTLKKFYPTLSWTRILVPSQTKSE